LTIARVIRIVFGVLAGLMLIAALADIVLFGQLTIVSPVSFGALLTVALAFLINNLLTSRERREMLERQTAELKASSARLEASLRNAAAMNQRLYQSEVRYKGLVDAQGDAIFRRDSSSRLTYANEAFIRMFGLDPKRAIGFPFAPELHPESRAPLFGSFAALEQGRGRARTTSTCAPPAIAGSPGKITPFAIPMAGWWKCKAWAATSPSARPGRGADRSARFRRGRVARQVRLPGHHESRNPHPDERRAGHGTAAAGNRSRPTSAPMPKPSPIRAKRCSL
jgi:PAS domain-containing protein